jgi:branched-chain amino acid aminotransferase
LPEIKEDSFVSKVKNYLTDLRTGKEEDVFGWMLKV